MSVLASAIIGGMIGNVCMAFVLFVLREWKQRRDAAVNGEFAVFTRLPRSPYLAVRFWRSLRI